MGFLDGNLLGLAWWWVSRAGALQHPDRMSPLQNFWGNISDFAVCGLFHQLFIYLKFCHEAIKHRVGGWMVPLYRHVQPCSPKLGNLWHPTLFRLAWCGPAALPHVALCACGGAPLHWPLLSYTTRPPTTHSLPPLLEAPIALAITLPIQKWPRSTNPPAFQ